MVKDIYRSPELLLEEATNYDGSIDMWSVGILMGILFSYGNSLIPYGSEQRRFVNICQQGVNMDSFVDLKHDPTGYDLLHRLLMINPLQRINVTDALNHPFFLMYREQYAVPFSPQETVTLYPTIPFVTRWRGNINELMRCKLVSWMIEVTIMYQLSVNTLFLSIDYLDYYVSKKHIDTDQLQLLAISCFLMASKIIDVDEIELYSLMQVTVDTYTSQQIIDFERSMIMVIKERLYVPTSMTYLNILKLDEMSYHIAIYHLCTMIPHVMSRTYNSQQLTSMALSEQETQDYLSKIPRNQREIVNDIDTKLKKHLKLHN